MNKLVSVLVPCKDDVGLIGRCIESVLHQTYEDVELVVQDGGSSDGTMGVLEACRDPRLKASSQPDAGFADRYSRALERCRGDIVLVCLPGEELVPGAIEQAVAAMGDMAGHPDVGAITFGACMGGESVIATERHGGEFNLVDYLFAGRQPVRCNTFFRRDALRDADYIPADLDIDSVEFALWCHLGTRYVIPHVSHSVCGQASEAGSKPSSIKGLDYRLAAISSMFSADGFAFTDRGQGVLDGFSDSDRALGTLAKLNQCSLAYEAATRRSSIGDASSAVARAKALVKSLSPVERFKLDRLRATWDPARSRFSDPRVDKTESLIRLVDRVLMSRLPAKLQHLLLPAVKNQAARIGSMFGAHGTSSPFGTVQVDGGTCLAADSTVPPLLYSIFANLYFTRGQLAQANEMWKLAEPLNDSIIDGAACQGLLMSPSASNQELLDTHLRWGRLHASSALGRKDRLPMRAQEPNRKIKIGYHCAFMDSDTIRFQMGSILRNHDRSRFHITGYSALRTISDDIRSAFDEMRSTRGLPKEQFAELVRNDQIDVLVELTGFSPGHRFRALALRCAPIQVSYLNHTGTSGVANVDYVLADDICVPAEEDRFFTEKVWRLPGSFFCFNYDSEDRPLPGPPPSIQAGHVTFGCFGSGPKINDELIAIWSRILHRVPGSVLFVKNGQMTPPDNRQFMLERFRRHGIDEGRLRVEGGASRSTIMDCYSSIDISLDTWPYSGGNTIAESIWQGVPVVTLKGDRFSSRYGASLVSAAGCADLIGDTAAQYEEVAVGLAHSPDRLSYLRQNLRSMAKRFGLCDAENFSRKLEEAYVGMLSVRAS